MPQPVSIVARLVRATSKIEPHELKATAASFAFVFLLMASYYILRPVRDAMASDWSDAEVSFLWNINAFVSAGIVAVYGFAISRLRFRQVAPVIYCFFALTFVSFYVGVNFVADRTLIDKTFYLWVSVFALFHVSVFWTLMADTFTKEQSRRLFSVIAAGASLGALLGPAVPTLFADRLGVDTLMLIASCGLLVVIPLVFYIYHLKSTELDNEHVAADLTQARMGGAWWNGFRTFVTNPMLLGIGIFIVLYVFLSSFIYFGQKNLLAEFSRAERTEILGGIDWLVNTLTFGLAFFATGRLATRFGMPLTLAIVPVFIVFGMLILAIAPLLTVLLALQVARRAGNFGITRPAREMLYTQVSREERFKAKPVVDIVVYRGGDAVSASVFALLSEGLGLALGAIAAIGSGIAAVWAGVAVYLGRRFERGETTNGHEAGGAAELRQT